MINHVMRIIPILLLLLLEPATQPMPPAPAVKDGDVTVYFSQDGRCEEAVIYWIGQAEKSLDVAIYSMTSVKIARAMKEAHERGVVVRVVMDKMQNSANDYRMPRYLVEFAKADVWFETGDGSMHNKYVIIDGGAVLTGSFNFTNRADEKNDENLVVIHRERVAAAYMENFGVLLKRAEKYTR